LQPKLFGRGALDPPQNSRAEKHCFFFSQSAGFLGRETRQTLLVPKKHST
jgi:hypothetical protein